MSGTPATASRHRRLRRAGALLATGLLMATAGTTATWAQTRQQPSRPSVKSRQPSRPTVSPRARRGFTVQVLEPLDNAIVFGPSRIAAQVEADDPSQVAEVAFFVGDEKIFVDREAPFQTVHDFGSQPASVVVRVVATHVAGFTVEDAVVTRFLRLSYQVEVRRVVLTLTVVGEDGRPLLDLDQHSFAVEEDGVPQEIVDFAVEERPLRIGLVLDTSGSMREKLPQVQFAAHEFLDVLQPADRALVVDFDDQVMLLQGLTSSREDLRTALMSTFARGGTAMYDAVHATLRRLSKADERRAIVLLSDGGDTASVVDADRAREAARTADIIIYAIGIGGADKSVLKSLTEETGGRAYFVDKADELGIIYSRIADELRTQYVVAYASSNPAYDGKWRKVRVRYNGPGNGQVRTRRGYYAVQTSASPLDRPLPPAEPEDAAAADSPVDAATDLPPAGEAPAATGDTKDPDTEAPTDPARDSPALTPASPPPEETAATPPAPPTAPEPADPPGW